MKREILFKAICIETGEWVEGFYWIEKFKEFPHVHHIIETYKDNKGFHQHGKQVHPETVCQFTGLLDKNGNKIFEGDIVKASYQKFVSAIGYIVYNCEFCRFEVKMKVFANWEFHFIDEIEITGNIHDK